MQLSANRGGKSSRMRPPSEEELGNNLSLAVMDKVPGLVSSQINTYDDTLSRLLTNLHLLKTLCFQEGAITKCTADKKFCCENMC